MTTIHVNDVGTRFRVTITEFGEHLDISAATSMKILLQDPEGNKKYLEGSFLTNGEDGIIEGVTEEGDIDIKGDWKMQGFVRFGTSSFHSDISTFNVLPSLHPGE